MVDLLKIKIKAGNGGDGIVSFHHEKYKPKGGPDGGNGGDGGSIYLEADPNLLTLRDLSSRREFKAMPGDRGGRCSRTGRSGVDLVIKVPVGTVVGSPLVGDRDRLRRPIKGLPTQTIADLTEPGQRVLVAQGGTGGRGNETFKSATHQVPREWTPGTPGEEKELILELKILADVGLIGLPNAGKSTLLNALTSARAVIGAYPFTTLEPNLGIFVGRGFMPLRRRGSIKLPPTNRVGLREGIKPSPTNRLVVADIPGLIKGASQGKGIGDEFLRHIERCRVLVHAVEVRSNKGIDSFMHVHEIVKDYLTVINELGEWSESLARKPEIVVLSKIDVVGGSCIPLRKALEKELDKKVIAVSAKTGEGLSELKAEIARVYTCSGGIYNTPKETCSGGVQDTSTKTFTINDLPNKRMVFKAP